MYHSFLIHSFADDRGEWGGDSGERGFSGTTIKDTWTKPRGRMEAEKRGGFGWSGEKMQTTVFEQQ